MNESLSIDGCVIVLEVVTRSSTTCKSNSGSVGQSTILAVENTEALHADIPDNITTFSYNLRQLRCMTKTS